MEATAQEPSWTSQFRELILDVNADLHDLRLAKPADLLDADDYGAAKAFGAALRAAGADGVVYSSVRGYGDCAGLFYPDLARTPVQGGHLDYHWDGKKVDLVRDATDGTVYRVI